MPRSGSIATNDFSIEIPPIEHPTKRALPIGGWINPIPKFNNKPAAVRDQDGHSKNDKVEVVEVHRPVYDVIQARKRREPLP
jgi:hypothetical protein